MGRASAESSEASYPHIPIAHSEDDVTDTANVAICKGVIAAAIVAFVLYIAQFHEQTVVLATEPAAWPADFVFSSGGWVGQTWNCLWLKEELWNSNYICSTKEKADPGLKWSMEGPIDGMRCHKMFGTDNYLCEPAESYYNFQWTSTNHAGMTCIEDELKDTSTLDRYEFSNQFLCANGDTLGAAPTDSDGVVPTTITDAPVAWPAGFSFSSTGTTSGVKTCLPVSGTELNLCIAVDAATWFTSNWAWSETVDATKKCTEIRDDTATSHGFLCEPATDSHYYFQWSLTGEISGLGCISFGGDKYLCANGPWAGTI